MRVVEKPLRVPIIIALTVALSFCPFEKSALASGNRALSTRGIALCLGVLLTGTGSYFYFSSPQENPVTPKVAKVLEDPIQSFSGRLAQRLMGAGIKEAKDHQNGRKPRLIIVPEIHNFDAAKKKQIDLLRAALREDHYLLTEGMATSDGHVIGVEDPLVHEITEFAGAELFLLGLGDFFKKINDKMPKDKVSMELPRLQVHLFNLAEGIPDSKENRIIWTERVRPQLLAEIENDSETKKAKDDYTWRLDRIYVPDGKFNNRVGEMLTMTMLPGEGKKILARSFHLMAVEKIKLLLTMPLAKVLPEDQIKLLVSFVKTSQDPTQVPTPSTEELRDLVTVNIRDCVFALNAGLAYTRAAREGKDAYLIMGGAHSSGFYLRIRPALDMAGARALEVKFDEESYFAAMAETPERYSPDIIATTRAIFAAIREADPRAR